MLSSLFAFHDYKAFLRKTLQSKDTRGEITRLAQAAGCQRSYLSRVIHEHVHLTPDQAFGIAQGLKFNAAERDYFLLLVDRARCGTPALIAHLDSKLQAMRQAQEDLSQRLGRETRDDAAGTELAYYSSWVWPAVHLMTSIPDCQSETQIAHRLGLPEGRVHGVLTELEARRLVRREGSRWKFQSGSVHIPKASPLVSLHHNNWRQQAVLESQDPSSDSVHYTMVQTLSRDAYLTIKQKMLLMIEESASIGQAAPEEELVAVCCDLFRVGTPLRSS